MATSSQLPRVAINDSEPGNWNPNDQGGPSLAQLRYVNHLRSRYRWTRGVLPSSRPGSTETSLLSAGFFHDQHPWDQASCPVPSLSSSSETTEEIPGSPSQDIGVRGEVTEVTSHNSEASSSFDARRKTKRDRAYSSACSGHHPTPDLVRGVRHEEATGGPRQTSCFPPLQWQPVQGPVCSQKKKARMSDDSGWRFQNIWNVNQGYYATHREEYFPELLGHTGFPVNSTTYLAPATTTQYPSQPLVPHPQAWSLHPAIGGGYHPNMAFASPSPPYAHQLPGVGQEYSDPDMSAIPREPAAYGDLGLQQLDDANLENFEIHPSYEDPDSLCHGSIFPIHHSHSWDTSACVIGDAPQYTFHSGSFHALGDRTTLEHGPALLSQNGPLFSQEIQPEDAREGSSWTASPLGAERQAQTVSPRETTFQRFPSPVMFSRSQSPLMRDEDTDITAGENTNSAQGSTRVLEGNDDDDDDYPQSRRPSSAAFVTYRRPSRQSLSSQAVKSSSRTRLPSVVDSDQDEAGDAHQVTSFRSSPGTSRKTKTPKQQRKVLTSPRMTQPKPSRVTASSTTTDGPRRRKPSDNTRSADGTATKKKKKRSPAQQRKLASAVANSATASSSSSSHHHHHHPQDTGNMEDAAVAAAFDKETGVLASVLAPPTGFGGPSSAAAGPQPPPPPPPTTSISMACAPQAEKDEFLLKCKDSGMTYRQIRAAGQFAEAESTLRGRHRTLTKSKEERVRKPEWTDKDIQLLIKGVRKHTIPSRSGLLAAAAPGGGGGKVPWKHVAEYIYDKGGSYKFGNATCRKKYDELMKGAQRG